MRTRALLLPVLCFALATLFLPVVFPALAADDPTSPPLPVKLVFIHRSTGENWLADGNGGLGIALRDAHYFVSDTNTGWGPGAIGNRTDIGHWWTWFRGPNSDTYLSAALAESGQNCSYSRLATDPGGPNRIVLFKSDFPNSALGGSASDPIPPITDNPLRDQGADSPSHTLANAQGIYIDLLSRFRTRPDVLFVVITAPPLGDAATNTADATNARALNEWLVHDWLAAYPLQNVFVFDFYNVLTTSAGDSATNDAGLPGGNHHRWWQGAVQHRSDVAQNTSAYPTGPGDDHPTRAGNQKATAEFLALLNVAYHRWANSPHEPAKPSGPAMLTLY